MNINYFAFPPTILHILLALAVSRLFKGAGLFDVQESILIVENPLVLAANSVEPETVGSAPGFPAGDTPRSEQLLDILFPVLFYSS